MMLNLTQNKCDANQSYTAVFFFPPTDEMNKDQKV